MPNANQIEPTEKQTEFITSIAKYSCFSGGFGSGKTYAGCLRALLLSQFPGNRGLVGRLTYPELRDTTRKTFFEVCPPEYYDEAHGGQWKPSENYLKLVNGSEIIFRHLDNVSEKELLSLNLGWFFIDQAEEVGGGIWTTLQSRLRLGAVPNRYGFVVCNPEPGSWIDTTFRKPILEGKRENLTEEFHFIESKMTDNPYLPPDYVRSIIENYPEEMRKRYVEGRWDVFENQIYSEYDYSIHCLTPFDIPKDWERIVSVDHGMVNPTAALWAALDYDGNCVAPETKLLTEDLRWVKAGEIKEGDVLAGFDETVPETKKRRWKKSKVELVKRILKPSYRLTLSDDTQIVCSADHQWLVQTPGSRKQWKSTEDLKPEYELMRVLDTWEEDNSHGAGYLAAAFDGEGSFGINQRGTMRLSFVQNDNEMIDAVETDLQIRGYEYGKYKRKNNCNNLSILKKRDILRFLGSVRPERLLPKFKIEDMKGFSAFEYLHVVKKEFIGLTEVVAIQTSTRTYVAEGLASHNCYIYDEYYSPGIVSQHAKEIINKSEKQEISLWLIDPSTQAKTREKEGQMWSIMEEYEDCGLFFTPANNEKLAGINRVKEFLRPQKNRRNPITKEIPSPRIFIFKNCVNLISEMPAYQWRKLRSLQSRNSPEQPRDFNDHAVDALRYIIMSRFPAPLKRSPGDSMILPEERRNMNLITAPMQQRGDDELGSFYQNQGAINEMSDLEESL